MGPTSRFGRRAAASSKEPPTVRPGMLPLSFQTVIRPEDVLVHVHMPGHPFVKGRPQHTKAKLYGTGKVMNGNIIPGSGDLRLVQGTTFTPTNTQNAEEAWRWVFNRYRTVTEPVPAPCAMLLAFYTTGSKSGDWDNLGKLISDAGNGTLWADDSLLTEVHVHVLRRATEAGTQVLAWRTHRRVMA